MEKLKQKTVEQYRVREGSPVGVQWAVRWMGEELWWEGFVEKVYFKLDKLPFYPPDNHQFMIAHNITEPFQGHI